MIKIITPGITNKYTNTCDKCMCVYEYSIEDVLRGWDYMALPYIMCPYCGARNNLHQYIPYRPEDSDKYKVTCDCQKESLNEREN